MATKFEIETLAESIRKERAANVAHLENELETANAIIRVMPNETWQDNVDRNFMLQTRLELIKMLNEERDAVKNAYYLATQQLDKN